MGDKAMRVRQAARKFVEYWTFQRGSEKGEDQQFWNSLLRDVLGVADVERCIQYQVPVPMGGSSSLRTGGSRSCATEGDADAQERVPPVSGVRREQIRVIKTKTIFDNGRAAPATHINGYLMDAPDAWIESRSRPLCAVPKMRSGGKPVEGGHLILTTEEKNAFLEAEPKAARLIRPFMGSEDYIYNKGRWCLWLKDVSPAELRSMPTVLERVRKVRDFRLASIKPATRKAADTPWLFMEIKQPETDYIMVPATSSENRTYIPMGWLSKDVVASNAANFIPNATLYHFGVLTSSVHMAWMRAVAGRLEMRYRYSAAIVYNNFPWPEGNSGQGTEGTEETEGTRDKATAANLEAAASLKSLRSLSSLSHAPAISATAQTILDARARYPDSSLADLYDPLTMPADLRAAHEANDRAVLAAYGLLDGRDRRDPPGEPEIVAYLFGLYARMAGKEAE